MAVNPITLALQAGTGTEFLAEAGVPSPTVGGTGLVWLSMGTFLTLADARAFIVAEDIKDERLGLRTQEWRIRVVNWNTLSVFPSLERTQADIAALLDSNPWDEAGEFNAS